MTVLELKTSLQEHVKRCAEEMSLVFMGRTLSDNMTIKDYKIPELAILHLVLNLRGC